MKKAKFKIGQSVRCVNETNATTVVGITWSDGFYYDVKHYNGDKVHRLHEDNLVNFKSGK